MKEIQIERKVYDTYYEAVDGTQFKVREECEKYEQSALGVLRAKLKDYIVNDKYDCWDLMGGNEDNKCLAISVPTEEAKDIILQNYYLDQPYLLKEDYGVFRKKIENKMQQAYENNDIVLFGLNCDDCLYFIDTRMNIINRLNSLDKKEETE